MKSAVSKFLVLLAAACALVSGCVRPALPPFPKLDIARLDTAGIRGKTIVIDPGHGGPERGALAQNGLNEAEVNLGVALYLWGFLKEAGANPVLTRSSDASVCQGQPFALRQDLQARADIANNRAADLFVSIHHNSDGREKGRLNDLIVFFRLSDTGSSRDVAREVCSALQNQLSAEPATVQPGNYMVLRESRCPAILGEASYMNYKKNSDRLVYHRTLMLEAQGYFLGLLSYFAKGVPSITFTAPAGAVFASAQPDISARLASGAPAAVIDPGSATALLDGRPADKPAIDAAGALAYTPREPLANGGHRLCLDVRNSRGNAAPQACLNFSVALPPAVLTVEPVFPVIPADGLAETALDITVLDTLGRPVMDGTPVRVAASAGTLPDNQTLAVKKGRARIFLRAARLQQAVQVHARSGGARGSCTVRFGAPTEALVAATLLDGRGAPVEGAVLKRGGCSVSISDEGGRAFDRAPEGCVRYEAVKKGFEPAAETVRLSARQVTRTSLKMQAISGGVFFNRTVMLDAADGSESLQAILDELQAMIERAGGTAPRTWERPPVPASRDRVLKSAAARADFFLTLAGGKKPAAEYYYKSGTGALAAELACSELNGRGIFGKRTCSALTGTEYVLMHTSMPALLLRMPPKPAIRPADAARCLYDFLVRLFQTP